MLKVWNYCQEKMQDLWIAKANRALIAAVKAADEPGARRALEAGADVSSVDPDEPVADAGRRWFAVRGRPRSHILRSRMSNSPMHIAAARNDVDMMKLLHGAGASVDATNAKRQTPLHTTTRHRCLDAMEWLLQAGAVVDDVDVGNKTPLTMAVTHVRDDTYVKLLLQHGADPNPQGDPPYRGCRNVLEYAFVGPSINSLPSIVMSLLEAGAFADIDRLRDDSIKTTLNVYMIGMNVLGRLRYGGKEYRFVEEHLAAPRSLKLTAACAVRAGLRRGAGGRSILQPALALPLPRALIRYVSLTGSESRLDTCSDM